jgi:chromosome partitioning protein
MRTIAIVNQKGGCGKTMTAINLSAFLARNGRKVLLVDMDPQGHATLGVRREVSPGGKTIADVLLRELTVEEITLRDVRLKVNENLDVVPSNILLSIVPEQLAEVTGRENKLAEALYEVRHLYHYAIIDCPPHVGLLTFNALTACSEAILTLDPSFFALHGIGKLLETLDMMTRKTGKALSVHALITLFVGRSPFVREVIEDIRKHLGDRVFNTVIRYSVKLAEAASHGLPIVEYCERCAGYEDYRSLTAEVLAQEAGLPAFEVVMEGALGVGDAEKRMLAGLTLPSPPIPTDDGVIFTFSAPAAGRVQLAGDFNSWVPEGNEMHLTAGIWHKVIPLAPGRYRYRYVVDGCWQADPSNTAVEVSPYGDYNSVVVFGGNGG